MAGSQTRSNREDVQFDQDILTGSMSELATADWTPFRPLMRPTDKEGCQKRKSPLVEEKDQYFYRPKRLEAVPEAAGLFELLVRKKGGKPRVVYLGNTNNLRLVFEVIAQTDGHKFPLMHLALRDGWKLHTRFRLTKTDQKYPNDNPLVSFNEPASLTAAQYLENQLLATYDYGWNVRRNNTLRPVADGDSMSAFLQVLGPK